jgi:hypothetical protein
VVLSVAACGQGARAAVDETCRGKEENQKGQGCESGQVYVHHFLCLLNWVAIGQSEKCEVAGSAFSRIGFMGMVAPFGVNHSSMLAPHGHLLLARYLYPAVIIPPLSLGKDISPPPVG